MSKKSVKEAIERHYYRAKHVRSYPTINNEPSMTDQGQASETDINLIVDRFLKRGIIPAFRDGGQFLDTTEFPDLAQASNAVIEAQNIFNSLPAKLRETFKNNPQMFFSHLQETGTQLEDYLRNPQNFQKNSEPQKEQTGSPPANDDAIKRDDKTPEAQKATKGEQNKT